MKPHVSPSSIWLPVVVVALLILGFALLMLLAEPAARIPPLAG